MVPSRYLLISMTFFTVWEAAAMVKTRTEKQSLVEWYMLISIIVKE